MPRHREPPPQCWGVERCRLGSGRSGVVFLLATHLWHLDQIGNLHLCILTQGISTSSKYFVLVRYIASAVLWRFVFALYEDRIAGRKKKKKKKRRVT